MRDPKRRDAEGRQHLDLEYQRRGTVPHNGTGQAPHQSGASGYIKLAMGLAFVTTFAVFGFSVWFLIPAAILIGLGLRDLNLQKKQSLPITENDKEKGPLSAIRYSGGSITPAEAAIETSLTVREADAMLSGLANGGHLQLESQDGALYYSLPGKRTELRS